MAAWTTLHEQQGDGAQEQDEGPRSYVFNDKSPLLESYYRLRIVDQDGSYSFSDVAYLKRETANVFAVFPNPSNGQFSLHLPAEERVELTLVNLNGKVLHRSNSYTGGEQNFEGLAVGVYWLVATTATKRWTKRVVIH